MNKKYLLRGLAVLGGILGLFVITLGVHIYMVTRPNDQHHMNWQLSRIDFEEQPDSLTASLAVKTLKGIEGVKHVYLNQKAGTLVYGFETGKLDAQMVFEEFKTKGDFKAKPYIPLASNLSNGCPVIDKTSLTYRLGVFFQNLFS